MSYAAGVHGAGDNSHGVRSIAQLYNDSDYINEQSVAWGEQVKNIYTTIAELKESWAGEFSKQYTDAVEAAQPDLIQFASDLSVMAATLATASNMYKALEAGMPVGSADEVDANKFSETDTGMASTDNEVTFDPDQCKEKAQLLSVAADRIDGIIEEVGERIVSINDNYYSPNGTELVHKVQHMRDVAPDYVKSIRECADCLVNVVAPQYAAIETYVDTSGVQ